MRKNKIADLIIDAANNKILFKIISKDKTYINEYENCRKNFDKFSVLLIKFLTKKQFVGFIQCVHQLVLVSNM